MMSCRSFVSDFKRGILWTLGAERHEKIKELKQLNIELLKLKRKCNESLFGDRNNYEMNYTFIEYIKVKEKVKLLNNEIIKLNDKIRKAKKCYE